MLNLPLDENVVLGLDIGYASIGWAMIRENAESHKKCLVSRTNKNGEVFYAVGSRIL